VENCGKSFDKKLKKSSKLKNKEKANLNVKNSV
jgi:hypothetical protein